LVCSTEVAAQLASFALGSCVGMAMGNDGSGLGSEDSSGDLAPMARSEWRVGRGSDGTWSELAPLGEAREWREGPVRERIRGWRCRACVRRMWSGGSSGKWMEGAADEWAPPNFYFAMSFESALNFHTSKLKNDIYRAT
jgi:hypothetical protein